MTIFLVVGIVGFVLLVLSFILDGAFDAFEVDTAGGIFSVTALTAMLATFGFTGVICMSGFGMTVVQAAIVALIAGVLVDILVAGLTRVLRKGLEGPIERDVLIGTTGVVITPVPGGSDWGEISIRLGGQPMKMSAVSEKTLPIGTSVRIVAVLSSTGARVVALDDEASTSANGGLPSLN